jgi:tetratricopeptide (TPR) repeat protein
MKRQHTRKTIGFIALFAFQTKSRIKNVINQGVNEIGTGDSGRDRKSETMGENTPSILKLVVAVSLATLPAHLDVLAFDHVFDKVKDSVVLAETPEGQGGMKGRGSPALLPSLKPVSNKDPGPSKWAERAAAFQRFKDWQGMLNWCLKWTESEPKNADAWYGLGAAYVNLKRYSDAVNAYRQVIRIRPKDASAWINLGIAYDELRRYNDAIDAYRQVIRIHPKDASAWTNLAATYYVSGNRSAALDAVRELRRLDPEKADRLLKAMSRP